jgi:hypothetical protein
MPAPIYNSLLVSFQAPSNIHFTPHELLSCYLGTSIITTDLRDDRDGAVTILHSPALPLLLLFESLIFCLHPLPCLSAAPSKQSTSPLSTFKEDQANASILAGLGLQPPQPLSIGPILVENPVHFVLFLIQDEDICSMNKKVQASIWTAEEITNLSVDHSHYQELSPTSNTLFFHTSSPSSRPPMALSMITSFSTLPLWSGLGSN